MLFFCKKRVAFMSRSHSKLLSKDYHRDLISTSISRYITNGPLKS